MLRVKPCQFYDGIDLRKNGQYKKRKDTVMNDNFKAAYLGEAYHNIDGTGWPDAVVMENQGSVLDGTYESIMYYLERTTKLIWNKYSNCWKCGNCDKKIKPDWSYCPHCGAKVVNDAN